LALKLAHCAALGRPLRQDEPISELGISTHERLKELIRAGKAEEACELVDYLQMEGKDLHDAYRDWTYADLTFVAERMGEDAVPELMAYVRAMMLRASRKVFEVDQRTLVQWLAEEMRAHRSGPGESGTFTVKETETTYEMEFDPCGSCGRIVRGGADGSPPRDQPPYSLGVTSRPYPWSWGKAGVPYYHVHTTMWHEILPVLAGGTPLKVSYCPTTDNRDAPCRWVFYKDPRDIPSEVYERVGLAPPAATKEAHAGS
jgi:hypothetical protein